MQTHKTLAFMAALLLLNSCKKFVEIPGPENQVIAGQVFVTDSKATSAVTGIYGFMINGAPAYSNFLTTVFAGISSDELSRFNPSLIFQEFMNNKITPANAQVRNLWTGLYKQVYYANACIEGIQQSAALTPATVTQLTVECRFIRSVCYMYLINMFGDVPLLLTTDYQTNALAPRTATETIWQQIITDLTEAKNKLPEQYSTGEKLRPNKWAAAALLARACLYNRQWSLAEEEASSVINSGLYTPLQAPATVFLKNSKEAIWQLAPRTGVLQETSNLRPAGTSPQIFLTPYQLAAFEPNDLRRQRWVDSITTQSVKYYYPAKYRNTTATVNEYYMVLRIAEQILIRAEALAQQNKLTEAISDLNTIRTRAALPPLPATLTQQQILDAVDQERRVELFAEWGHRWFDLKRTGRINTVMNAVKPAWQPTAALFPLPQDDVLTNSNLTQNPGY